MSIQYMYCCLLCIDLHTAASMSSEIKNILRRFHGNQPSFSPCFLACTTGFERVLTREQTAVESFHHVLQEFKIKLKIICTFARHWYH